MGISFLKDNLFSHYVKCFSNLLNHQKLNFEKCKYNIKYSIEHAKCALQKECYTHLKSFILSKILYQSLNSY